MGVREYPSTTVRVEPSLWDELTIYAKASGRKKMWIFNQALREWLARNPK